jgi:hypothetical protein
LHNAHFIIRIRRGGRVLQALWLDREI